MSQACLWFHPFPHESTHVTLMLITGTWGRSTVMESSTKVNAKASSHFSGSRHSSSTPFSKPRQVQVHWTLVKPVGTPAPALAATVDMAPVCLAKISLQDDPKTFIKLFEWAAETGLWITQQHDAVAVGESPAHSPTAPWVLPLIDGEMLVADYLCHQKESAAGHTALWPESGGGGMWPWGILICLAKKYIQSCSWKCWYIISSVH